MDMEQLLAIDENFETMLSTLLTEITKKWKEKNVSYSSSQKYAVNFAVYYLSMCIAKKAAEHASRSHVWRTTKGKWKNIALKNTMEAAEDLPWYAAVDAMGKSIEKIGDLHRCVQKIKPEMKAAWEMAIQITSRDLRFIAPLKVLHPAIRARLTYKCAYLLTLHLLVLEKSETFIGKTERKLVRLMSDTSSFEAIQRCIIQNTWGNRKLMKRGNVYVDQIKELFDGNISL